MWRLLWYEGKLKKYIVKRISCVCVCVWLWPFLCENGKRFQSCVLWIFSHKWVSSCRGGSPGKLCSKQKNSVQLLFSLCASGKCCDEGKSYLEEVPDSPASQAFKHIIESKSRQRSAAHSGSAAPSSHITQGCLLSLPVEDALKKRSFYHHYNQLCFARLKSDDYACILFFFIMESVFSFCFL